MKGAVVQGKRERLKLLRIDRDGIGCGKDSHRTMCEFVKIQYFWKPKGDFSDTQQVTTTRRILLRFWGGSKFKYNIGNPHFFSLYVF